MAANVISSTMSVFDVATGPIAVTESVVTNFDIDDFVHFVALAEGEKLNLYQLALVADPQLAANRTPVQVGDVAIGGF